MRAVPADKCLRGVAESEITVKAAFADVQKAIAEINAAEDKTTAEIIEKAALLKAAYPTLTDEEKAQINTFDYILAITLEEADWTYIGACTKVEGSGTSELTFQCQNAAVKVKACDNQIIKVWCEPSGKFYRRYESCKSGCGRQGRLL